MKTRRGKTAKETNPQRYLIGDFLEMKTRLSACEREILMDKIEAESPALETLKSQPAFWIGKNLLLILNQQPDECWFYYSDSGRMEKMRIKNPALALGHSVVGCL